MTTESIWLEAKDGAKLFTKVFRPETQPVGCIAMVHGYGEHTGRYLRVAEFFCDRGYVFAIHDQRGHGKSPGTPRSRTIPNCTEPNSMYGWTSVPIDLRPPKSWRWSFPAFRFFLRKCGASRGLPAMRSSSAAVVTCFLQT